MGMESIASRPSVSYSMSGRYSPPFGSVGEALDRALLHRVAEATVRDFVERVAASITRRIALECHPNAVGAGRVPLAP